MDLKYIFNFVMKYYYILSDKEKREPAAVLSFRPFPDGKRGKFRPHIPQKDALSEREVCPSRNRFSPFAEKSAAEQRQSAQLYSRLKKVLG